MAAGMKFDDRARETSTAPGTGNFTMNGAVQGAITFATFMTTTGDYAPYAADNGTAWESGYLTKQANGTYARTVKRSTNGNAAVNFSTGTVSVFCDLPAWLLDNLNFLGEAVTSAATMDIGTLQSVVINVSGTTGPVTSLGTGKNKFRIVVWAGATVTCSTASLSLLGVANAANRITAAGDVSGLVSDNSGNWKEVFYQRAADISPKPSFSAHKNGTNQTGVADVTFTQVTYGTELYDVGGYFASNAWTPPAGKVHLDVGVFCSGTVTTGAQLAISIFKDGVDYKQGNWSLSSVLGGGAGFIGLDDIANGSNVYTVYVYIDTSSGTATIDGNSINTFFTGHWIGP